MRQRNSSQKLLAILQQLKKKSSSISSSSTVEDLIKDAVKYALDDTKKRDLQLLERSNDLQSLVRAKEDELKELDKMEESLSIRKKNI